MNYKLISRLIFIFLLISLFGSAQQDPLFTQYFNNPLSINPAYAGSRGTFNIVTLHRRQWIGIEGAPVTTTITLNKPTKSRKIGLGLSFINDNIGPIAQNGIYADYAYHLKINYNINLSFGLKGGFNHYKFNLINLAATHPDDEKIINGEKTMFLPNVGFGSYLYADNFVVGFSIPKLLRNSLTEEENSLQYVSREERHYFFSAATIFNVSQGIRFRPSFITRIVQNSPISLDINAQFIFADKFWIGASYRLNNSLGANLQLQVSENIKIGYAYDLSASWLRPYNSGTHEIMLNFDFNLKGTELMGVKFF